MIRAAYRFFEIAWLVLLFGNLSLQGVENDAAPWSKPVNGIRGRLFVLLPDKAENPFCRVYVEFQNVENVLGQKKINFDLEKIQLKVINQDGTPLSSANEPYDGMKPLWKPMELPLDGAIRFRISFPGMGYSPGTKTIVDIEPPMTWMIPDNGSTYYLTGTFTVPRKERDQSPMDWSGTLEFPRVEIPRGK